MRRTKERTHPFARAASEPESDKILGYPAKGAGAPRCAARRARRDGAGIKCHHDAGRAAVAEPEDRDEPALRWH